jgi:hypothetical protein
MNAATGQDTVMLAGGLVADFVGEKRLDEAVTEPMIRLECEMVQEANPLYRDAELARSRGHTDIGEPPAMLLAWALRTDMDGEPRHDAGAGARLALCSGPSERRDPNRRGATHGTSATVRFPKRRGIQT